MQGANFAVLDDDRLIGKAVGEQHWTACYNGRNVQRSESSGSSFVDLNTLLCVLDYEIILSSQPLTERHLIHQQYIGLALANSLGKLLPRRPMRLQAIGHFDVSTNRHYYPPPQGIELSLGVGSKFQGCHELPDGRTGILNAVADTVTGTA
ncbi:MULTISPECIES: hypothetical protein [Rhizobium]|uniref:hypothetical protein n=1 Tax=Rhizobium TaxID=379 RepID=UPI001FEFEC99|nr:MULTISPECIES: hypothetical protein [Rhizobium]